jgi:hypothetical protein
VADFGGERQAGFAVAEGRAKQAARPLDVGQVGQGFGFARPPVDGARQAERFPGFGQAGGGLDIGPNLG